MEGWKRTGLLILVFIMMGSFAIAEKPIGKFREPRVFILNQELESDIKPFIQNGTTMVPLRGLIETIGGDVRWIPEGRQILIILKGKIIDMKIGSTSVKVNGQVKEVGNPPMIKDGFTMIPARAIADALGYDIFFRENTGNVYIQSDMFRLRSIYGPNI